MSKFQDYIQNKLVEVNKKQIVKGLPPFTPAEWISELTHDFKRYSFVTHIGKFSHPDVNLNCHFNKSPKLPGLLHTETVNCTPDIVVNGGAKYISGAAVLMARMDDGRHVWEHAAETSQELLKDLTQLEVNIPEFFDAFNSIEKMPPPQKTSQLLKQIYFPVNDEGTEHILCTVLASASVIAELRERLSKMAQIRIAASKQKKGEEPFEYAVIPGLTAIKFGGDNPQNISINNRPTFLLPSIPPTPTERLPEVPWEDFFKNTLKLKHFIHEFTQLHKVFKIHRNTKYYRDLRKEKTALIIDKVYRQVYKLRGLPPGWSDARKTKLPAYQKAWLDTAYRPDYEGETFQEELLAKQFTFWFFNTYGKVMKTEAIAMGDAEIYEIQKEIGNIIRKDRG